MARQCPNKVICFVCNRLGHRAAQCRAITKPRFGNGSTYPVVAEMKRVREDDICHNKNRFQQNTSHHRNGQLVTGSVDENKVGTMMKAKSNIPTPAHKLECTEHRSEQKDRVDSVYEKEVRRSGSTKGSGRPLSGADTTNECAGWRQQEMQEGDCKVVKNESDLKHFNLGAGNKGNMSLLGQTQTSTDIGGSNNVKKDGTQCVDNLTNDIHEMEEERLEIEDMNNNTTIQNIKLSDGESEATPKIDGQSMKNQLAGKIDQEIVDAKMNDLMLSGGKRRPRRSIRMQVKIAGQYVRVK